MSHNVDLETTITDPLALQRALLHMGFEEKEIKVHSKKVDVIDYFENKTGKKATVLINKDAVKRVTGCLSNDLGFEQKKDGTYTCHMDDGVVRDHPDFMTKLNTYYGYEKSKIELEARKIQYTEGFDADGRLQLNCTFKKKNKGLKISL